MALDAVSWMYGRNAPNMIKGELGVVDFLQSQAPTFGRRQLLRLFKGSHLWGRGDDGKRQWSGGIPI